MGESGTGTARFNYLYQLCHPPRTDARRWKGLAWQQKRVRSHQPLQQEEGIGCEPKHEQGEGIKPPIEAIKSLKKVTVWTFTTVNHEHLSFKRGWGASYASWRSGVKLCAATICCYDHELGSDSHGTSRFVGLTEFRPENCACCEHCCCGRRLGGRGSSGPFMFRFLSPVLMWFQTLCHSPLNLPF